MSGALAYGRGGGKRWEDYLMYTGPDKKLKDSMTRPPNADQVKDFILELQDVLGDTVFTLCEQINVPVYLCGKEDQLATARSVWPVLSSRLRLWNKMYEFYKKQKGEASRELVYLYDILLDSENELNTQWVSTGQLGGLFNRLRRLESHKGVVNGKQRTIYHIDDIAATCERVYEDRSIFKRDEKGVFEIKFHIEKNTMSRMSAGEVYGNKINLLPVDFSHVAYTLNYYWPNRTPQLDHFREIGVTEFDYDRLIENVVISEESSAGPFYFNYKDREALKKGDPRAMTQMCKSLRDIEKMWKQGRTYSEMYAQRPDLFVCQLKPKTDKYTYVEWLGRELDDDETNANRNLMKTRPYFNFPFHLTIVFSSIAQWFGNMMENFQEDRFSTSMIGMKFTGGGTRKLMQWIQLPPENVGVNILAYGDDAVYRFQYPRMEHTEDGDGYNFLGYETLIICPDVRGMDFTLNYHDVLCMKKLIEHIISCVGIASELENMVDFVFPGIWKFYLDLWIESAIYTPVMFHGPMIFQFHAGLRSGIPGTTYFDQIKSLIIYKWIKVQFDHVMLTYIHRRDCIDSKIVKSVIQAIFSELKIKYKIEFKKFDVFTPFDFVEVREFPGLMVTPYEILGHRICKYPLEKGEDYIPVKSIGAIMMSLIKPTTAYNFNVIADMVELDRMRGMAYYAFVYPTLYQLIKYAFFKTRAEPTKFEGKDIFEETYPISSTDVENIMSSLSDRIVKSLRDVQVSTKQERIDFIGIVENRKFGDPNWFPSEIDIINVYLLKGSSPRTNKVRIIPSATEIEKIINEEFKNLFTNSWADAEDDKDMKVEEYLAEHGMPGAEIRGKTLIDRYKKNIKILIDLPPPLYPTQTKVSQNPKKIQEHRITARQGKAALLQLRKQQAKDDKKLRKLNKLDSQSKNSETYESKEGDAELEEKI